MKGRDSFLARVIYRAIDRSIHDSPVAVKLVFPDGSIEHNHSRPPDLTITIKEWWTFARLAIFGNYGFATDFVKQRIDIEGDLRYLGYLASPVSNASYLDREVRRGIRPGFPFTYLMNRWHMLTHLAWSYASARYNAEYHYGLHPEFYFNYLGKTGAYSTGFWYEETKNVDEAQHNKWEFILKKLRLTKPGLRICSVGTGFGYGEMLAAGKYEAIVDCYNTCRPQNKWLREEVKRRGLEGRVNVFDMDYRDVGRMVGKYDRFLAIECIEHAQDLFRKETIAGFARCLKDDGVGVMQWLSYDIDSDVSLFIRKWIYPGVTMPPLGRLLDEIAFAGCEVLDLLCARRHYHYTLNAWADNFVLNWEKTRALDPKFYNESFRRKWLLYLASGAYYLAVPDATARLYQVTFSKGDTNEYPMNREFLYAPGASDAAWVKPQKWVIVEESGEPEITKIKINPTFETFDPVLR